MVFFRPAQNSWKALGLVAFITTVTPGAAAGAVCDGLDRNVEATVRVNAGSIQYDNNKGRADLEQLRHQMGAKGSAAGGHPLGVTLAEFQADILTRVQIRSTADRHCAALSAVEVTLGYPRLEVYVDRRYKPGTCEYAAVLDHESRHVHFFRDTLEGHKSEIHAAVIQSARKLQPTVIQRSEDAASYFQDRLTQLIQPSLDRLGRKTERLNASIDTAANYRAIQALCAKW